MEKYAKELLIFQVKVFSLPIEDVSKEKIEEFKNEFNELKKMGKLDWDAEAVVENYYDEIGKIVDKLEKLLNDEDLIFGNHNDDLDTIQGVDAPVTLGEVAEMNMTNQDQDSSKTYNLALSINVNHLNSIRKISIFIL